MRVMSILRVWIPALAVIVIIWCIGWHVWRLLLGVSVFLGYGIFMEAFGAYERDFEEYQKRLKKANTRRTW